MPFILHLDRLSLNPPGEPNPSAQAPSSILPSLLDTLADLLGESPRQQVAALYTNSFAVMGLLLRSTASWHLTEEVLAALERMLRRLSWSPYYIHDGQLLLAFGTEVEPALASTLLDFSAARLPRWRRRPWTSVLASLDSTEISPSSNNTTSTGVSSPVSPSHAGTPGLSGKALWNSVEPSTERRNSATMADVSGASELNGRLPGALAVFPSLFGQAFLNLLLDFPLWYRRSQSAAGSHSPLSRSQSNPVVGLALARLIGRHFVHAQPMFFRALFPPSKIVDALRRFFSYNSYYHQHTGNIINFISDDAWTLEELRAVRSVWCQTLHALICAGGTPSKPMIELKDIELLVHASTSDPQDPLANAELLEMLTALLLHRTAQVLPHLTAIGGPLLFVAPLAQSRHEIERVASLHMLNAMLLQGHYLPDNIQNLLVS